MCNSDLTGVVTSVRQLQSVEHHRAGVGGSRTLLSPYAGNHQISKDRGEHTIQCSHTSEVESAPYIWYVCIRVMAYIYPRSGDWEE